MRRLHVFGCSHTYGHGITPEDCVPGKKNQPTKIPSKHSWAANLAKSINFELINHACPGSSNHGILNQVKKAIDPTFPYKDFLDKYRKPTPQLAAKSGDIAAILFTYYSRSIIYNPNGNCDQILPPHPEWGRRHTKITRDYYRLYNIYHMEQISLYDIEHTYLYLENIGIPFIAMFVRPISNIHKPSVIKQIGLDAADPIEEFVRKKYSRDQLFGADNDHWSTIVHIEIAKIAEQKIQSLITSL